jgi:hypothetical protein
MHISFFYFQTFVVFWMLYSFFWLIIRRLNFMCRRFGALCLFNLHGRCKLEQWLGWVWLYFVFHMLHEIHMLVSPVWDGSSLGVSVNASVSVVFFQYVCVLVCVWTVSPSAYCSARGLERLAPLYDMVSAVTYCSSKKYAPPASYTRCRLTL